MNARQQTFLFDLLSQPTAPFREQQVEFSVCRELDLAGIPWCHDPVGNILIGVSSVKAYRQLLAVRSDEPVRIFMAHMDHPGFHGVRWMSGNRLQVKWYGGSPVKHLPGADIYIAHGMQNHVATGRIRKAAVVQGGWAIDTAEIVVDETHWEKRPPAKTLFGSFRFRAPVWKNGRRIYTNAADDLCGVFAIVETARAMKRRRQLPFVGLLTRAEEVGFVGAVAHFETGWLQRAKRPVLCVSLEASRTLPGAVVGKGPVVRLGDRRTVFHADYLKVLSDAAEASLPGRHQKRVMDGGACEATAATAWGIPAIGVTLPLGNYHNQGLEGGPDCRGKAGPAPEFVSLNDIEDELVLCRALMKPGLRWSDPWGTQQRRLRQNLTRYQRLLRRE